METTLKYFCVSMSWINMEVRDTAVDQLNIITT